MKPPSRTDFLWKFKISVVKSLLYYGISFDMMGEVGIHLYFSYLSCQVFKYHLIINPLFPSPSTCRLGVINPLLHIVDILSLFFNFGYDVFALQKSNWSFLWFPCDTPFKRLMNFASQIPGVLVLHQQMVTWLSLEAQCSDSQVVVFELPRSLQSESSSLEDGVSPVNLEPMGQECLDWEDRKLFQNDPILTPRDCFYISGKGSHRDPRWFWEPD